MKKAKKYVALYTAMNEWTVPFEAEDDDEALDMAEDILEELYEEGPFDYSEAVSIDIYEVSDEDDPDFEDELDSIMALVNLIRDNSDISDRTFARMILDGMEKAWGIRIGGIVLTSNELGYPNSACLGLCAPETPP